MRGGCGDGDGKDTGARKPGGQKHSRGGGGKHWGGRAGEAEVGMPLFLHPPRWGEPQWNILSPSRNPVDQVNGASTRILYTCLCSRRSSLPPQKCVSSCGLLTSTGSPQVPFARHPTPAPTQHLCFSKQVLDETVATGDTSRGDSTSGRWQNTFANLHLFTARRHRAGSCP